MRFREASEFGMLITDHETEVDYLNCEAISKTVVELLDNRFTQPITLGVHGDWGAGKSSILKMIESELLLNDRVAVLWFNAWTFEGFDDAKTTLIEATITELCRKKSAVGNVKERATRLLKRVKWLKLARRASGVAFNFLTGLPSSDQVGTIIDKLHNTDTADRHDKLDELVEFLKPAQEEVNVPESIHQFRIGFQDLLEEANIDQLVVLLDDLDRCLPTTAIESLEAIRLFLFVPKTAFVIGADEAMIEYAVRQHFPDLPVATGPLPYARNYLEKLIQIPFRIPALGAKETRTYVTLLLVQSIVGEDHPGFAKVLRKAKDILREPWHGSGLSQADIQEVEESAKDELNSAFVLAQQIAPILAEGTKGNPRQIKRFLNALLVRQVIAKARGFGDQIKQPVLAKLMLTERFQPDFYEHLSTQAMSAEGGTVSDLAILELGEEPEASEEEEAKPTKQVDATSETVAEVAKWRERDWLAQWLQLEPKLEKEDLRPYVFVARDKRLLASVSDQGGLETLMSKLCGSQIEIRSTEPEVKALSSSDAGVVFNNLRERVLSVGKFTSAPMGMDGLAIIAKHHPQFQSEIVALLESIDPKNLGLWVLKGWNEAITDAQARSRLIELMHRWAEQSDNQMLKTGALSAISTLEEGEN